MKKYLLLVLFSIIIGVNSVFGQVSPYSISPDWYHGYGGRMTFPNGNFPTSGAPTPGNTATNNSTGVEASTSVCFRNGAVSIYTNTQQVYNASSSGTWTAFIRNFVGDTPPAQGNCSGSSTGGAVAFPDPANNATNDAFYVVTGNDETGGTCQFAGVNRYRFTGTGATVAYNAGPTNMAVDAFAGEAITASTDGAGGYWVIIHNKSTANIFRVWHFTTSGAITGPTDYNVGAAVSDVTGTQSYLKVSPCQDKIAYHSGGTLVVHNWDRVNGVVGAELRRIAPADHGVGLEFSPDGSMVYYSGQSTAVSYVNVGTGATGTVAGATSWSMQLGPDGKIYTSPGGATALGVISNANTAPSYGTTAAFGGAASIYRGLSNMTWLSPQLPVITPTATATCNVYNFSYVFQNYFNTNIGVTAGSEVWNFGDGTGNLSGLGATPSHTFPAGSGGPYTVTLTFTDATCGHSWTTTTPVTVTCPAPVELVNFAGVANSGGADLIWQTAQEINNDYFDLQRSLDGIHFQSIAELKGAGNSSSLLTYTYRDVEVTSGLVYYRLVQHDKDGKQAYSKIISVRFDKTGMPISVAPNPFSSSFTLTKIYLEPATITVYDVCGRIVEQKITTAAETTVSLGEALANGSYIVQYVTAINAYTLHIEKQ
ncbi:MAG TPA: T9SS type A sorting domain-containing protein, partial [Cytophagaceae bacterium]|jgi:hypothetical protein|nr:T9SS type A sorting domain-containing protein [Cytophagaceae bacterium]